MIYTYRCLNHAKERLIVSRPITEPGNWTLGTCPICGEPMELDLRGHGGSYFTYKLDKAGKWSGVYDFDYGKKATWDLTVPGKMDRLKAEGRIKDPFDSGPAPVEDWASDPRNHDEAA